MTCSNGVGTRSDDAGSSRASATTGVFAARSLDLLRTHLLKACELPDGKDDHTDDTDDNNDDHEHVENPQEIFQAENEKDIQLSVSECLHLRRDSASNPLCGPFWWNCMLLTSWGRFPRHRGKCQSVPTRTRFGTWIFPCLGQAVELMHIVPLERKVLNGPWTFHRSAECLNETELTFM